MQKYDGFGGCVIGAIFLAASIILGGVELSVLLREPSPDCPRLADDSATLEVQIGWSSYPRNPNSNVLGTAVKFEGTGAGIWDTNASDVYEASNTALMALDPRFVVFPAGPSANLWNWTKSLASYREDQTDYNGESQPSDFGLMEFLYVAQNIGSEPVLTFNVYDGTSEELQALIAYANGNEADFRTIGEDGTWNTVSFWASMRNSDMGNSTPFSLKYIELGYEVYNTDIAPYEINASDYASLVVSFTEAAKAIDPSILIGVNLVPLSSSSADSTWNDQFFEALLGIESNYSVDGFTLHIWQFYERTPYLSVEDTLTTMETYLSQIISKNPLKIPSKIWITSYARYTNLWYMDHDILDSLALSHLSQNLAKTSLTNISIAFACYFSAGDDAYGVFDAVSLGSGDAPYFHPSYYSSQILSSAFSGDISAIKFLDVSAKGANPKILSTQTPGLDILALSDNSTLVVVFLNRMCHPVITNIELAGMTLDTLQPGNFKSIYGNYRSKDVVEISGEDESSKPPKISWNDIMSANFRTSSFDFTHSSKISVEIPSASVSVLVGSLIYL